MLVRKLNECHGTDRQVFSETNTWDSVRMVLANDGAGFSFHITTIYAGGKTHIQYKNHIECVYCISGNMKVEVVATGEVFDIVPGAMYLLDNHDEHYLHGGTEDCVVACVFNPPIVGTEVHQSDGSYALLNN